MPDPSTRYTDIGSFAVGEDGWYFGKTDHPGLETQLGDLGVDVEVRDTKANRSNYTPVSGGKYFATDTGDIYLGDGSSWNHLGTVGGGEITVQEDGSGGVSTQTLSAGTNISRTEQGDGSVEFDVPDMSGSSLNFQDDGTLVTTSGTANAGKNINIVEEGGRATWNVPDFSAAGGGQFGSVQAVVYRDPDTGDIQSVDQGNTVVADGGALASNDLATVLENTYGATDATGQTISSVAVSKDTYTYTSDLVVPDESSLYLDHVTLQPDGCVGIKTGDVDTTFTYGQSIRGDATIRPNGGNSTATVGLKVMTAKRALVTANLDIQSGFSTAAMESVGGTDDESGSDDDLEGTWWNFYNGIRVRGRYWRHSGPDHPANAEGFVGCLFNGQMDLKGGNSLEFHTCSFEGITGGPTIDMHNATYMGGRFEAVDIVLEAGTINPDGWHIHANHWHNCTLTRNFTAKDDRVSLKLSGAGFLYGDQDAPLPEMQNRAADRTVKKFTQGYYNDPSGPQNGTLKVHSAYDGNGISCGIESIVAQRTAGGYHFRGATDNGTTWVDITPNGGLYLIPHDLSGDTGDYDYEFRVHDGSDVPDGSDGTKSVPKGLYYWDSTNAVWGLERDGGTTTI